MTVTRIPGTLPEHLTRDEKELEATVTELELVQNNLHDGHLTNDRWIVDGVFVKPQRGNPTVVTVWSPCCGRPRQRLRHGYAFSCAACGWWWRYHCLGWTTRIASIGRKKP